MTRNRRNSFVLFLVGVVFTGHVGCKKQDPAPQPPASAAKQEQPTKPVQKQPSSVKSAPGATHGQLSTVRQAPAVPSLDFTNRKDPFKPYIQSSKQAEGRPDAVARKRSEDLLPIQSFETEKFKVSGIIVGIRENRALLIDPNGKGYVVKEGMLIGSNDGHVTKITSSMVEVSERYRDDNGHIRKRVIKLTLIRKK